MKSLLLPALLLAGCVANDLNLTIDRFVPALATNDCVVSPDQTVSAPPGIFDIGLLSRTGLPGYTVFPVVTNHLPSNNNGGVERHAITLNGANVELQPDASLQAAIPAAQRKFFVSVVGTRIEPGSSVAVGVEVIPRALALTLAGAAANGPKVTALVSPVGDYSGDTVIGAALPFPIELCTFCLSGGQPQACPAAGFAATSIQAGGCIASQDFDVTCCVDPQMNTLCGAQVPKKTM